MPTIRSNYIITGEKEYKNALKEINSGLGVLKSEMKKTAAEFDNNADSVDALNKKNDVLDRTILTLNDKLDVQKQRLAELVKEYGEADTRTQRMATAINETTAALYDAQNQIGKNVEKLDSLDKEQGNVEDSGRNLNDVLDSMAGKLGVDLPEGFGELLGPLGNVSTEMLGLAGIAAGVGAKIVDCAKETMEYVDEVNTLASVSGLTTDTLQQFMFMEDLVDVSTEKFVDTTKDLTRSVGEAMEGNEELNEAFKTLGVTLVDEQGNVRDMEEIYWDVIDALAGMESGIDRDNTAMKLMGEGARDLNPLLDQTKEGIDEMTQAAEDCGYVMDENTLKNVQKLTDGLETLRRKITGSLRDAMGELANWLAGDLDASKMTTGLAFDGKVGHNAGGTDYWRGGLTWVGEEGPELVSLPRGTQIASNAQSQNVGQTTIYVYGAQGQDVNTLAEIVMNKIDTAVRRKEATFS